MCAVEIFTTRAMVVRRVLSSVDVGLSVQTPALRDEAQLSPRDRAMRRVR